LDDAARFDELYESLGEGIPWHFDDPPEQLVALVEGERVSPCRALEMGCGLGSQALYLARLGFEVTGVDLSRVAVERARARAEAGGLRCRFVAAELTGDLPDLGEAFELVWDWELLHHIFPPERPAYLDNVAHLLAPGGLYLSVSFSEEDPSFGGEGKGRETPLGTVLYFSSEAELRELYLPRFDLLELRTIDVRGKRAPHRACYALLEGRGR
jgi:SAM-dependent methyltransferase